MMRSAAVPYCFSGPETTRAKSSRARSLEALTDHTAHIYASIEKLASVSVFLSVEQVRSLSRGSSLPERIADLSIERTG